MGYVMKDIHLIAEPAACAAYLYLIDLGWECGEVGLRGYISKGGEDRHDSNAYRQ